MSTSPHFNNALVFTIPKMHFSLSLLLYASTIVFSGYSVSGDLIGRNYWILGLYTTNDDGTHRVLGLRRGDGDQCGI